MKYNFTTIYKDTRSEKEFMILDIYHEPNNPKQLEGFTIKLISNLDDLDSSEIYITKSSFDTYFS